jgi:hypothetical protein
MFFLTPLLFCVERHYVQATVEPNEGINVDLLQCQILSLVGLLPEEQILVTSRGEIISSPFPSASMALPSLPVSVPRQRERVFLIKAATASDVGQRVQISRQSGGTRCTFGDLPVVQPAFRTVGGGDSDALVCGACATTCSTGTFTPETWDYCGTVRWLTRSSRLYRFGHGVSVGLALV